jgi:DNA-binding beta-propeller fold protein YncE
MNIVRTSTKGFLLKAVIFLGVILPGFLVGSERNLSAQLEEPGVIGIAPSEMFQATCLMAEGAQPDVAAFALSPNVNGDVIGGDIAPARYVMDPYPTFNGIAVDGENGKILMSDTNRKGLLLYDRGTHSRTGEETSPERQVMGPNTLLGYVAGVAIDSERREIYGVNNDIEDNLSVFSYDDNGDLKPKRVLAVPHQAWGLALGRSRAELAVTIERSNAVVIYRREAQGGEAPVRSIQGASTGLADPHGVSWDEANKEIVVANHGHKSSEQYRGPAFLEALPAKQKPGERVNSSAAQSFPPSITIYPELAEGNLQPLRTIQGARTQLSWPMGVDVDSDRNQIAVVNNGDNSILFFGRNESGDVAPVRVIRGSRTLIDRPMGVALDRKNDELWIANFGNHTAVVFPRNASGNVAPRRVIRNAPAGTPTGGFGNPMAMAYDVNRSELLVPN